MGNVRVVYRRHPGISSEEVRDARARAWKFIFGCYEAKKGPVASQSVRGKDGTKAKEDSAYGHSILE